MNQCNNHQKTCYTHTQNIKFLKKNRLCISENNVLTKSSFYVFVFRNSFEKRHPRQTMSRRVSEHRFLNYVMNCTATFTSRVKVSYQCYLLLTMAPSERHSPETEENRCRHRTNMYCIKTHIYNSSMKGLYSRLRTWYLRTTGM
jgi:hypothetical protein